jgi:FkbM family methyltransferase
MTVPLSAKLAKSLGFMRHVRGWPAIATKLAKHDVEFESRRGKARFAGNLKSSIDREAYLYGSYDWHKIAPFLAQAARRGIIADVGANIGNHTLAFARHFSRVISFEPNPQIWPLIERNIAINPWADIELRKMGLGDEAADLPIFVNDNHGLSTFLDGELDNAHGLSAHIAVGDEELRGIAIDALKIDVQGFEPNVLRGLRETIEANRPLIWVEISETMLHTPTASALAELIPVPFRMMRYVSRKGVLLNRTELVEHTTEHLPVGDYLVIPVGYSTSPASDRISRQNTKASSISPLDSNFV